jgi:hypothetical protein
LLLQFGPFLAQQVPLDASENIELPSSLVNLQLFGFHLVRVIKNSLLLYKRSFGRIQSVFDVYLFTLRYLQSVVNLSELINSFPNNVSHCERLIKPE